jgi:hypothetical protein
VNFTASLFALACNKTSVAADDCNVGADPPLSIVLTSSFLQDEKAMAAIPISIILFTHVLIMLSLFW